MKNLTFILIFILISCTVEKVTIENGGSTFCAVGGEASVEASVEASTEAGKDSAPPDSGDSGPILSQLELAQEKIQHVVIIMQENQSFDRFFGTYPGADGISNATCNPDGTTGTCAAPYHGTITKNSGANHGNVAYLADLDIQTLNKDARGVNKNSRLQTFYLEE